MQFCVECAAENSVYDAVCVKCGTGLVLTQPRPEPVQPKAPKKPMPKKVKVIIAGLVAVIVGIGIIGNIDYPEPVDVTVAIKAPYGGVFADNCNLTDAALAYGVNQAVVAPAGSDATSGSSVDLTYVKSAKGCVAQTTASVVPGQNYGVYIKGELVGEIDQTEIEAGSASEEFILTITHEITGTIVLQDKYLNCKQTNQGPDCTLPMTSIVYARTGKSNKYCNGMNGYMDFKKASGTPIKFVGKSSKKPIAGKLSAGDPFVDIKTGLATCTYLFKLSGLVHDDKGYKVTIGKHSAPAVSISKIESNGWVYDHTFKG